LHLCKLVKSRGLKNVLVTNGFINEEPLKELLPYVDAMNIDLKSIEDGFYRRICKGKLEPVMNTIKMAAKQVHVGVTFDFDSLNDRCVTVRDRDSMQQVRIKIDELLSYFEGKFDF